MDQPDLQTCKSCGILFRGQFCHACGEKIVQPNEKSVGHFIGTLINEMTLLDGKFFRTIKLMLVRPGEVSYHYMNGKRVPFLKPMSMFFIANLLYFLFPLFNSLNSPLYVQMNLLPYSKPAAQMVERKIAAEKIDFDTFQIRYDQQSTNMAKLILILLVVYFSVPLSLINLNHKMFFYDHLLVSLEVCSLVIFLNFVGLFWFFKILVLVVGLFGSNIEFILDDYFIIWFSMALMLYLFYSIERRAYSEPVLRSMLKSILLLVAFFFVLQGYRASLFLISLWTV